MDFFFLGLVGWLKGLLYIHLFLSVLNNPWENVLCI